jgi:hypothetical protein
MSVGNLGVSINQLEGFIASEFVGGSGYPTTQGLSLLPDMVRQIASRADLTEANLRVTPPRLFDGTNDVTVEAGACRLIAIVAQSNASQSEDVGVLVYEAAVTEGTTRHVAMLNVDAGGSAATAKMAIAVYPEPVPLAALYWSVVDNGANGDLESTGLGDANGVKVMIVYAE